MRTYTPKPGEVDRQWHVIDATDIVLVRLASQVAVLLRGLIAVALDEEGARVAGLRVAMLNGLVSMLAALTIGVSMRIVGILLIAALMVLPVIAAQRVAWSVRSTMGISMLFGLGSVLVGLTVSYYGNLPPGGTIVLTGTAVFLVASLVEAVAR